MHFDICTNVECRTRIIQKIVQCAIQFEGFLKLNSYNILSINCLQLLIFAFLIVDFGIPMVGFCLQVSYAKHALLIVVHHQSNMEWGVIYFTKHDEKLWSQPYNGDKCRWRSIS